MSKRGRFLTLDVFSAALGAAVSEAIPWWMFVALVLFYINGFLTGFAS